MRGQHQISDAPRPGATLPFQHARVLLCKNHVTLRCMCSSGSPASKTLKPHVMSATMTKARDVRPMPQLNRRTLLLSAVASPFVSRVDASETQSSQDVSPYRVQDPMAGYFDLAERRRVMRDMPSLGIIQARLRAMEYSDCQSGRTVPVQDQTITIPSFYGDNEGWRKAVTPFRNIEDAVSNLAAGNLVSPERGYADCLVDLLLRWARRDALAKFNFSTA